MSKVTWPVHWPVKMAHYGWTEAEKSKIKIKLQWTANAIRDYENTTYRFCALINSMETPASCKCTLFKIWEKSCSSSVLNHKNIHTPLGGALFGEWKKTPIQVRNVTTTVVYPSLIRKVNISEQLNVSLLSRLHLLAGISTGTRQAAIIITNYDWKDQKSQK